VLLRLGCDNQIENCDGDDHRTPDPSHDPPNSALPNQPAEISNVACGFDKTPHPRPPAGTFINNIEYDN
jgi:hypothetical protein